MGAVKDMRFRLELEGYVEDHRETLYSCRMYTAPEYEETTDSIVRIRGAEHQLDGLEEELVYGLINLVQAHRMRVVPTNSISLTARPTRMN